MYCQAARLYFTEEASYRAVGRQLGIAPLTAFRWVNELGENCKGFEEIAEELRPQWGGYLLADGKAIFIRGIEHALLLTADVQTQDIPMAQLWTSENRRGWEAVFTPFLERIPYPLKGLIIDGDLGLWSAAKNTFPNVPIQLCVRHAENYLNYYFRYQYEGSRRGVEKFMEMTHAILYAPDLKQLDQAVKDFRDAFKSWKACGLEPEFIAFQEKIPYLGTHFHHPGMPRTNSNIEGIIRNLSRKIHDTDGFESFETAWNSLKLLIMNYRFHPFTCSREKDRNGFSPLELAAVDTSKINWVSFSQRKFISN